VTDSVSAVLVNRLNAVLRSVEYRAGDLRALAEAHRLRADLAAGYTARLARRLSKIGA
jgi:hypothetical protein